ncbi:glycosyltransferase family 4 protein [Pendulispora albinea]|uniref:Glycosyltransferase family 4 protein n=1 Tax=Pendulispora albinea TaxID=2741071 RepID=A0ABZ2LMZ5_9BACT
MHVVFDARQLAQPALRGADRYLLGLAGALVRRGVRVSLAYVEGSPPNRAHDPALFSRFEELPIAGPNGPRWEQLAVPRALARVGADIYHPPSEYGVPMLAPCPVVFAIHSATVHSYRDLVARGLLQGTTNDYIDDGSRLRARARHYVDAQPYWADRIVAPSEFAREEIVRYMKVDPAAVTTTPLATSEAFRAPVSPRQEETLARLGVRRPYVLYVGGYERHKNVAGVLGTYGKLRQTHPELALVLVGTGRVPEATQRDATALGAICLSDVTHDLVDLYDGASVFLSMSWRETFGLPSLEAMTRGVPAVVSGWGASPEVVGDAGLLVDPRREDEAAAAVRTILAERPAFSSRARERAKRFSWDATAAITLDVYTEARALTRRRPKRVQRWMAHLASRDAH